MRSDAPTALDLPIGETMADKKVEEFSAIGKQATMRGYSAMDYYFDHLKKTIASAPTGGTAFGEKVKACAEQNISSTPEFIRDLSYAKDVQDILRIQMEFMRSQSERFGEQAKELADAYIKEVKQRSHSNHDDA
jgi:hypothetical protein